MKIKSGNEIYLKFTADSGPAIYSGSRAVIKMMRMIIMLNTIIRYLNFNVYSPIIIHYLNDKRKCILRQRQGYRGIR